MSRTVRSYYSRWHHTDYSQCGKFNSRVAIRRRNAIRDAFVATRHLQSTKMATVAYADANPDWYRPYENHLFHKEVFRSGVTRVRATANRLLKAAEHRSKRAKHKQADQRLLFEYWTDCL